MNTDNPLNESEPSTQTTVIPAVLPVDEPRRLKVRDEEVIAIGSAPSGYTVLLSPTDWAFLRQWKLTRLRIMRGQVWASDGASRYMAARLLTATNHDATKAIRFRNGCFLDLRRENVVVVPYSLIRRTRIDRRAPDEPLPMVYRANGTFTPNRRFKLPAKERLRRLLHD